jgi:hypothetical protein
MRQQFYKVAFTGGVAFLWLGGGADLLALCHGSEAAAASCGRGNAGS